MQWSSPTWRILSRPLACRRDEKLLAAEVAQSLQFAPPVVRLADSVLESMGSALGDAGIVRPNALHLRMETDAAHWNSRMAARLGGQKVCAFLVHSFLTHAFQVGTFALAASRPVRLKSYCMIIWDYEARNVS